jgi:hypothetical protein
MVKGNQMPGIADRQFGRVQLVANRRPGVDFQQFRMNRSAKQPEHQAGHIGPGGIDAHTDDPRELTANRVRAILRLDYNIPDRARAMF